MALTDEDKHWINDRLDRMESRFKEYADLMESRFKEYADQRSEAIETRLLRAFRNFAHPVEARLRANKAVIQVYDAELEALTDRVQALEEPGEGHVPKPQ